MDLLKEKPRLGKQVQYYGAKVDTRLQDQLMVYRAWEALLDTSGVGWDPINKVVECSNDTWLNYIEVILLS